MTSYKYEHTHVTSPDPEKAIEFYTKILGLKVTREQVNPSGVRMVDLDVGGIPVRLSGPTGADTGREPLFGLNHFGIQVEDLDKTTADLKSKGVEFVIEPTQARPGLRYAFIKGPDNVRIELLEKKES